MRADIVDVSAIRIATIRHRGPYNRISEAFAKLGAIAAPENLLVHPESKMIAVYYDDPETTAAENLRSDAGIAIPADLALPAGLGEVNIHAGRYARGLHVGTYEKLGDTWARLMGEWLPKSGERIGEGVSFEVYRNTPETAKEADLKTEIYVPLA